MNGLSVIIPSRSPEYLQQTIEECLNKAKGDVEVIVVLDGIWPEPMPKKHKDVKIIHQGTVQNNWGLRAAINAGMSVAAGKYVMKLDEHCMLDEGYDEKLKADCQDDWLIVPRRHRLDAENWVLSDDGRPPVDYMYVAYPYERPYDRRCGLYGGGVDKQRTKDRAEILVDDTMSMQGSCYFTTKAYWDSLIAPLDDVNYGSFNHEAQEIHFKVQLSGGRFMVNKKTWYAHYHKGRRGKGYGFSREQYKKHEQDKEKARRYAMDYWLNTKDYKHDFAWLIDQYKPPGWDNWQERIKQDEPNDWRYHPEKQPSDWVDA